MTSPKSQGIIRKGGDEKEKNKPGVYHDKLPQTTRVN